MRVVNITYLKDTDGFPSRLGCPEKRFNSVQSAVVGETVTTWVTAGSNRGPTSVEPGAVQA